MATKDGPWWANLLAIVWALAAWFVTLALLASAYPPAPADRDGWVLTAVVFCTGWTLACVVFAYGLGWLTRLIIHRDGTSFFGWVAVIVSAIAAYQLRGQRAGQALRLLPGTLMIASAAFAIPLLLVLWATGRLKRR